MGHLPAGYLAACSLERSFTRDTVIWWAMLAGAVLLDIDMFWFALVDQGTVHHHTYPTHNPALWAVTALFGLAVSSRLLTGLGAGAVLHVALDSIAGAVTWGFAEVSWTGPLVEVPATQSHWILSFLLHWTFAVELVICCMALVVFWRRRRRS
ncbi:metal-dependent hydrolase [Tateyamaria sp. SN3-11]|uniref:metal-dependent hydrolase n=1 Tax=Tateyamaria sp. SN3-11 TaxID=3092147 RepID=UPI0039E79242